MRIHMKLQNCILSYMSRIQKFNQTSFNLQDHNNTCSYTTTTKNISIIKSKKAKHDWKGKNSEIHFVYEYYKLFVSRLADRSAAERGGGDTDTAPVRWSRQVKEPPVLHLHFTFILNILTVRRGDTAT